MYIDMSSHPSNPTPPPHTHTHTHMPSAASVQSSNNPRNPLPLHRLQLPKVDALHSDWLCLLLHLSLHQLLHPDVHQERRQEEEGAAIQSCGGGFSQWLCHHQRNGGKEGPIMRDIVDARRLS